MSTIQHRALTGEDLHPPGPHAEQHTVGGDDALTPSAIGAAEAGHPHGQLHDRQHSMTSSSDHAAAAGSEKGKYYHTNASTGAVELVDLPGSLGTTYPTYHLPAASLLLWPQSPVKAEVECIYDQEYLTVLAFDATAAEYAFQHVFVPAGATTMTIKVNHRAKTGSGNVKYEIGMREPGSATLRTHASADYAVTTAWTLISFDITLATLGVTAGKAHLFYLRRPQASSGNLAGDSYLSDVVVSFA